MPASIPIAVPGECPRRHSAVVPRRPLLLAPVASSAVGGASVAPPRTLADGMTIACPSPDKRWDCYPKIYFIQRNWIQDRCMGCGLHALLSTPFLW